MNNICAGLCLFSLDVIVSRHVVHHPRSPSHCPGARGPPLAQDVLFGPFPHSLGQQVFAHVHNSYVQVFFWFLLVHITHLPILEMRRQTLAVTSIFQPDT